MWNGILSREAVELAGAQFVRPFKSINSALSFWGYWAGRQLAADGYSTRCAIDRLFEGMVDSFGPMCLLFNLPPHVASDVGEINRLVVSLKRPYSEALIAKYCMPTRDERGYLVPEVEICRALGVTPKAFRMRIHRAKKVLEPLIVIKKYYRLPASGSAPTKNPA